MENNLNVDVKFIEPGAGNSYVNPNNEQRRLFKEIAANTVRAIANANNVKAEEVARKLVFEASISGEANRRGELANPSAAVYNLSTNNEGTPKDRGLWNYSLLSLNDLGTYQGTNNPPIGKVEVLFATYRDPFNSLTVNLKSTGSLEAMKKISEKFVPAKQGKNKREDVITADGLNAYLKDNFDGKSADSVLATEVIGTKSKDKKVMIVV